MDDLLESFGPDRRMALCRELTKDYEQIRRGTIGEIHNSVRNDPPRGEMVLVIEGASDEEVNENTPNVLSIEELAELAAAKAKDEGLRIKEAITRVVAEHPLPNGSLPNRKQVYAAVLAAKGE